MATDRFIYPLKLSYYAKETVWGGSKLSTLFGKGTSANLGETWELSVRNGENSTITNGPLSGMPVQEYIKNYTEYAPDQFPILIKFIDAKEDLSIQVHPDDTYAKKIGEKNGKTEMWYVIEAKENASIVYGTKQNVNVNIIKEAVTSNTADEIFNRKKVSAGDVFFIPGGLIHAIGNGILLAEIQQNSDTTFRLYDYGRKDTNGKSRPLHVEQAVNVFKNFTEEDIRKAQFSKKAESLGGETLASCDFFIVEKHCVSGIKRFAIKDLPFISILCIEGNGTIDWLDGTEEIKAGDSFYIPRELGSFSISGNLKLLTTIV